MDLDDIPESDDDDVLRHVGARGYRLLTWDTGRRDHRGQTKIGYAFYPPGSDDPLFYGDDFAGSPLHADDSDETVHSLLGFLTLRPGDTDADYFDNYTPEQMDFAESYAEDVDPVEFEDIDDDGPARASVPDDDGDDEPGAMTFPRYFRDNPRDDDDDRSEFADPGGRSALRAGTRCYPCPTCKRPDRLTAKDKRLGYQCDDCADRDEGGRYNPAPASRGNDDAPFSEREATFMVGVLSAMGDAGIIGDGRTVAPSRAPLVTALWQDLYDTWESKARPSVGPHRTQHHPLPEIYPAVYGYDRGRLRRALDQLEDDILFAPDALYTPKDRPPPRTAALSSPEERAYDLMVRISQLDGLWREKLGMARLKTVLRYGQTR